LAKVPLPADYQVNGRTACQGIENEAVTASLAESNICKDSCGIVFRDGIAVRSANLNKHPRLGEKK
jgi:hypothetical protein